MSGPSFQQAKLRTASATLTSLAVFALCCGLALSGCGEDLSSEGFNSSINSRYLYVSSGSCYAGGAAISTGNATITKWDLTTGAFAGLIADYNTFANGDMPNSMAVFGSNKLLVAVENTAGRRIDIMNLDGTGLTTYHANATVLSTVLRHILVLPDSSVLIAKSTAIEKLSAAVSRVVQGAAAFINAPAAPCATSTTAMTSTTVLPDGKIVYTHAAASPNNITGVISSTGYATAVNCLAVQAAPTTTALPTANLYEPNSGKLLVAYGSATTASNRIYSYLINQTTGAISTPVAAFSDNSIMLGPTRMTLDPATGAIFVANGASTLNNVEKFTLASDGTLTKVGTTPFIRTSVYTRCITAMEIAP
jgi:hypothetical protein